MNADARKDLNPYFEQKPDHLQKTAVKLMEIILRSHPNMGAAMRWSKPSFGLNGDFQHRSVMRAYEIRIDKNSRHR